MSHPRTFREGHGQFVKPTFPRGLEGSIHQVSAEAHLQIPHPILPGDANLPFQEIHGPIRSLSRLRVESL